MGKIMITSVKAATLVETIVALVIILVLFGIATTVIIQTTEKGSSVKILKAKAILDDYVSVTHNQDELFDQEVPLDDFFLKRQVSDYKENIRLKRICYYIYDSNKKLIETRNEIFLFE